MLQSRLRNVRIEKLARRQYYSGKHSQHTIKSQLLTTKKLILHVSGSLPEERTRFYCAGGLRDHALDLLPMYKSILTVVMKVAEKRYPNNKVYKPKRAQRSHPQTLFEKL